MHRPHAAAPGAALLVVASLLLSPAALGAWPGAGPARPQDPASAAPEGPARTARLVGFDPAAEPPLAALAALGATVVRVDHRLGFAVVAAPDAPAFDAAAALLPGVAYVEPDHPVQGFAHLAEEELQPRQWGLLRIGAPAAWEVLPTRDRVPTIAILDTGVDWKHPDLAGAVWNGNALHGDDLTLYASALSCALRGAMLPSCFFLGQPPEESLGPMDYSGHGTHVAGIAAATREGLGMAGVAPATVRAIKVLPSGNSVWSVVDVVATGIGLAAAAGADIISMSLGCWCESQTLERAVHYAWTSGSLLVAAAGNYDSDIPVYPGAYRDVISVSATDPSDGRWRVGSGIGSSFGGAVDLAAPGADVLSARSRWASNFGFYYVGPGYRTMSGTSMATPHVAGVAALVWQAAPELTNAEVRAILEATAEDLGEPGRDDVYGHGLVDAEAAVRMALKTPPRPWLPSNPGQAG